MKTLSTNGSIACFALALTLSAGCTQRSSPATGEAATTDAYEPVTASINNHTQHSHDGWWCDEHGVPEEVCGQCSSRLAADFQKRGDWCKDHDRPDSQCFMCHPELEGKFAAQYVAKFGTQPPKAQD